MAILTRLSTTVTSRYYPVPDSIDAFFLDGRLAGRRETRSADVTSDKEEKAFLLSVFSHAPAPGWDSASTPSFEEPLDALCTEIKEGRKTLDDEIGNIINTAVAVTGRMRLQNSQMRSPYFTGLIIKDGEAFAVTMGKGLAFLYRDDTLYPLTAADISMEPIDTTHNKVDSFYNYCAAKTATAMCSNIAQLRMDDCLILCSQTVYDALGQRELLRILDEAHDQSDAAGTIMTEAAAKLPGVPMQFMISFVESVEEPAKGGFFGFGKRRKARRDEDDDYESDDYVSSPVPATAASAAPLDWDDEDEGHSPAKPSEKVIPLPTTIFDFETPGMTGAVGGSTATPVPMTPNAAKVTNELPVVPSFFDEVPPSYNAAKVIQDIPEAQSEPAVDPASSEKKVVFFEDEAVSSEENGAVSADNDSDDFDMKIYGAVAQETAVPSYFADVPAEEAPSPEVQQKQDVSVSVPEKQEKVNSEDLPWFAPAEDSAPAGITFVPDEGGKANAVFYDIPEADAGPSSAHSSFGATPVQEPSMYQESPREQEPAQVPVRPQQVPDYQNTQNTVHIPAAEVDAGYSFVKKPVDVQPTPTPPSVPVTQSTFRENGETDADGFFIPFESGDQPQPIRYTEDDIPDMPIYDAPVTPPSYPEGGYRPTGYDPAGAYARGTYDLGNDERDWDAGASYVMSQNSQPSAPDAYQSFDNSAANQPQFPQNDAQQNGFYGHGDGAYMNQAPVEGYRQDGYQTVNPYEQQEYRPQYQNQQRAPQNSGNPAQRDSYQTDRRPQANRNPQNRPSGNRGNGAPSGRRPYADPERSFDFDGSDSGFQKNKIIMIVLAGLCLLFLIILIWAISNGSGGGNPVQTTPPSQAPNIPVNTTIPTESEDVFGTTLPEETPPPDGPQRPEPTAGFTFTEHLGYRTWWDFFKRIYNIDIRKSDSVIKEEDYLKQIREYNNLPADYEGTPGDSVEAPPVEYFQPTTV